MKSLLRRIRNRLAKLMYRRNYYLSKIFPARVPIAPLHYLPDGFSVHTVGNTGLRVVDNFCTPEEANYLINVAREQLSRSRVVEGGKVVKNAGRTSAHAVVFHRYHQDSQVLPMIARGAMLAGVPIDHAEQIYVSRYGEGELYHGHVDFSRDFKTSDRLCTLLIYLNSLEMEAGGATYFRDLNVAVKPTLGRAVCWTNMNPDGSPHFETAHAALPPVGPGAEKWVVQLWFRPYEMHPVQEKLEHLQVTQGEALSGNEELPEGVWITGQAAGP